MKIKNRTEFSLEDKYYFLSKSNCLCARCGRMLYIDKMTVEHVIPLSKGGTNKKTNLIALCYTCNKKKSNTLYLPSRYYKYLDETEAMFLDGDFRKYKLNQLEVSNDSPITIVRFSERHTGLVEDVIAYFCDEYKIWGRIDLDIPEVLSTGSIFGIYIGSVICGIILGYSVSENVTKVLVIPIHIKAGYILEKALAYLLETAYSDAIDVKIRTFKHLSIHASLKKSPGVKCSTHGLWGGSNFVSRELLLSLFTDDRKGIIFKDFKKNKEGTK